MVPAFFIGIFTEKTLLFSDVAQGGPLLDNIFAINFKQWHLSKQQFSAYE